MADMEIEPTEPADSPRDAAMIEVNLGAQARKTQVQASLGTPGAAKRPGSQPPPTQPLAQNLVKTRKAKQRSRLNLLVLNRAVTASHLRARWRNQRKPARQKRRTEEGRPAARTQCMSQLCYGKPR